MKKSDFDFYLPEELIAQTPLEKRDGSRLLVLDKESGAMEHRHFYDLPEYLRAGDCLVLNNSRVLPARLIGTRPGCCATLARGDGNVSAGLGARPSPARSFPSAAES